MNFCHIIVYTFHLTQVEQEKERREGLNNGFRDIGGVDQYTIRQWKLQGRGEKLWDISKGYRKCTFLGMEVKTVPRIR